MSITKFTVETEKNFDGRRESRTLVVNGELETYVWDGTEWILTDTLTTDSYEYYTKNTRIKFVPLSGSFSIDMEP